MVLCPHAFHSSRTRRALCQPIATAAIFHHRIPSHQSVPKLPPQARPQLRLPLWVGGFGDSPIVAVSAPTRMTRLGPTRSHEEAFGQGMRAHSREVISIGVVILPVAILDPKIPNTQSGSRYTYPDSTQPFYPRTPTWIRLSDWGRKKG